MPKLYTQSPHYLDISSCFEKTTKVFLCFLKDFVDISSKNPHKASFIHLGIEDFKGFVTYAKYNRDSYESELGFCFFIFHPF